MGTQDVVRVEAKNKITVVKPESVDADLVRPSRVTSVHTHCCPVAQGKLAPVTSFAFDYVYDKYAPQQLIYESCIKV